MKVIHNKILPFGKDYIALNIFGVIFAKEDLGSHWLNHEYIHTAQQKEMLYVFFFLWYALEWVFRVLQYRSFTKGYMNISFEREAYQNMYNLHYPHLRRRYQWFAMIRKRH